MAVKDRPKTEAPPETTSQDSTDDSSPPIDGATAESSPWPTIDGRAVWGQESVAYLFDPESRELVGANVTVWYDDGVASRMYKAEIRRDGDADTWNWHADGAFQGSHTPDIGRLVSSALDRGRASVLQRVT